LLGSTLLLIDLYAISIGTENDGHRLTGDCLCNRVRRGITLNVSRMWFIVRQFENIFR